MTLIAPPTPQEMASSLAAINWLESPQITQSQLVAEVLGISEAEVRAFQTNAVDFGFLRHLGFCYRTSGLGTYVESVSGETRNDTWDRILRTLSAACSEANQKAIMIPTNVPENPIWNGLSTDHLKIMVPFDNMNRSGQTTGVGQRVRLNRVATHMTDLVIEGGEEIHYQEVLVGWFKNNTLFLRFNPFKNESAPTGAQAEARKSLLASIIQAAAALFETEEDDNEAMLAAWREATMQAGNMVATSLNTIGPMRNNAHHARQELARCEREITNLRASLEAEIARQRQCATTVDEYRSLQEVAQRQIGSQLSAVFESLDGIKALPGVVDAQMSQANGASIIKITTLPLVLEHAEHGKKLVPSMSLKIALTSDRSHPVLDVLDARLHPSVGSRGVNWGNSTVPLVQTLSQGNYIATARLMLNTLKNPTVVDEALYCRLTESQEAVGWQIEQETVA